MKIQIVVLTTLFLFGCSINTPTTSIGYQTQSQNMFLKSSLSSQTAIKYRVKPTATTTTRLSDEKCQHWIERSPIRAFATAALGFAAGGSGIVTIFPEEQKERLIPGLISLGFGVASVGMIAYNNQISSLLLEKCEPEPDPVKPNSKPSSQPIGALIP